MKKLAFLTLALLLVPGIVNAQCNNDGDPVFWRTVDSFPGRDHPVDVVIGTWAPDYWLAMYNFDGPVCSALDTFCVKARSLTQGWPIYVGDPYVNTCIERDVDWYWWYYMSAYVPCTASPGDYDTIAAFIHYCNFSGVCDSTCVEDPPCSDPNVNPYSYIDMYSSETLVVHAILPPEYLYILQDTLFPVNIGDDAAEVYFQICSGDPCDTIWVVDYAITSLGLVGPPVAKVDTVHVGPYSCEEVYATVDASLADVCDRDTLTIIAYYADSGYYDTCVSVIHVVEPLYIVQDSIFDVEQGQTIAYVPFSICNGNPYAGAKDFGYHITSPGSGSNIPAIDQSGTVTGISGGECDYAYGIIDAGTAIVCEMATLTIVAWDIELGFYDTCVQIAHVVEPTEVPLFTTPVVTILVLAMILAAAVIMRKRATSKA
jgi:hypothetical protein